MTSITTESTTAVQSYRDVITGEERPGWDGVDEGCVSDARVQ